jgi:hypothetical protein
VPSSKRTGGWSGSRSCNLRMARSASPTGCRVIAADAVRSAYRGDGAGRDPRAEAFWEADVLGVSIGRYALEGRLSIQSVMSSRRANSHPPAWRMKVS